jgi:biotin carboxyl carrier protein
VDILTKYVVRVEDKQYEIGITKTSNAGHFTVEIDDKSYDIEVAGTRADNEKPLQFKMGDRIYAVQINKKSKQEPLLVKINDIPLKAEVKTELPIRAIRSMETSLLTPVTRKGPVSKVLIEGAVTAPMTGKIVSVKVKKGDSVTAGEILCVLEAMKMENEIVATKTGRVRKVSVSEGSTVNEGDTLIILE